MILETGLIMSGLTCTSCDYKGLSDTALFLHRASTHLFTPKFECDVCKSLFSLKDQVIEHIIKTHENEETHTQEYGGGIKEEMLEVQVGEREEHDPLESNEVRSGQMFRDTTKMSKF